MAIRSTELDEVVAELRGELTGAALQRVRVPAPDRVALSLRRPGASCHLLIVVQSPAARLHAVERAPRGPTPPQPAQARLRALLRGRCASIERDPVDRIVRLAIGAHTVLVELTGRHGNLFVLDAEDTVLTSLLPNRSHRRDLRPGRRWQPPASPPPAPRPSRFEPPDVGAQLAAHYGARESRDGIDRLRIAALRRLRTVGKRLRRKAERQLDEATRADRVAELRREADLLNAHGAAVARGATAVQVADVFEPDAPARTIAVDPARTARENIERRYRQARRLERGMARAERELTRTEQQLAELAAARAAVEAAADEDTLARVVADLPRDWRPPEGPRRRVAAGERLPYRRYRTRGGQRILVGRSAADNDTLTFRHARGRDLWLHVVARPGAHVLIPLDGPSLPDPSVIEQAAQLAMAHSGFAEGDDAEVAWTRAKYVRKVRGGPPGLVHYSQERVLRLSRSRAALEGVELDE